MLYTTYAAGGGATEGSAEKDGNRKVRDMRDSGLHTTSQAVLLC